MWWQGGALPWGFPATRRLCSLCRGLGLHRKGEEASRRTHDAICGGLGHGQAILDACVCRPSSPGLEGGTSGPRWATSGCPSTAGGTKQPRAWDGQGPATRLTSRRGWLSRDHCVFLTLATVTSWPPAPVTTLPRAPPGNIDQLLPLFPPAQSKHLPA